MQIRLIISNGNGNGDNQNDVKLDPSSTLSSWLIDHYFTHIYCNQVKTTNKYLPPNSIIGLHDMFIVCQIVQSSVTSKEFLDLCKKKVRRDVQHSTMENYNKYLQRCGLNDLIDLFHQCQVESSMNSLTLQSSQVQTDFDRLVFEYLVEQSTQCRIGDQSTRPTTAETKQVVQKLIDNDTKHAEQTISKNYIKHTLCTYLSLLLDTRNEHALIHCLMTPTRLHIERRTIVEVRRLSKLPKNECLTIYQILLSFIRRKELISNRLSSSQPDEKENDDESFVVLDKYYLGIKEFFDFIEQLQMKIEEDEHSKVDSTVTFGQLMGLISKQLRKDVSFHRCDSIIKEVIEELCQCFRQTIPVMDCVSPTRSASSGGSLAGRRFLRSVAYLCAKQTIDLPIIQPKNDHYDSPSTGLRKATSFRLLQSPLTPLPMVIHPSVEVVIEEKPTDIPLESVFMWHDKGKNREEGKTKDTPSACTKRYRRRKSHRCLDLSTIHEASIDALCTDSNEQTSSQTSSTTRQPLAQIDVNSFNSQPRQAETEKNLSQGESPPLSLVSESDKENLPAMNKKRLMPSSNAEQPRKKQKKTVTKELAVGQRTITNFFQSKS